MRGSEVLLLVNSQSSLKGTLPIFLIQNRWTQIHFVSNFELFWRLSAFVAERSQEEVICAVDWCIAKLAFHSSFFPGCIDRMFISWPGSNARNKAVTTQSFTFRKRLVVRSLPHELAAGQRSHLVHGSLPCTSGHIAFIAGASKRHLPVAFPSPVRTRWRRSAI